jgi:CheY-like chemotaxis protein
VDGYEVSSHVKTTPGLQHIPVLLLAGAFEPVDDARVRDAQCDGVLIKPFEPRQLVNRVLDLIKTAAARKAAAPAAPVANGHAAAAEPAHQPPAWYRPEPSSTVRVPPAPVMDASLDDGLSAMPPAPAPRTPAPAPVTAAVPMPGPVEPEPVSSPMSLDLTFDPSIGTEPERLDWSSHNPDGSLELQALPGDIQPVPAPPPLEATSAPKAVPPAPVAQAGDKVTLSTAFSALLAAEQTHGGGESTAAMTDAALEEMMRRMLLRVTDDVVRKVVLEAAERMVKEEIDRIKSEPESASSEPESASGTEPETK